MSETDAELAILYATPCDPTFDSWITEANHFRSRAEAAEAEVGTLKQSCESWNELVQDLQAEAARLRNDLLAYGHHLESCKMLCIAKTDGWKIAKLHGCSCGFDTAKEK